MTARLEEGSRVRVVRAPHRLLTNLVGKEGEVKKVIQTENGRIFKVKVHIRGHWPVWLNERQIEPVDDSDGQVPEADGGPEDPREVGP